MTQRSNRVSIVEPVAYHDVGQVGCSPLTSPRRFGVKCHAVVASCPLIRRTQVAEALINPLGEDDDDFELNYVIDRNVQVGFTMVDELYGKHPKLCRDPFWDEIDPVVPYTAASSSSYRLPFLGSVTDVQVSEKNQEWIIDEDDETGSLPRSSATSTPALSAKLSTVLNRSVSQLSTPRQRRIVPRPSNASDLHVANLKRFRNSGKGHHHLYTRKISTASGISNESLHSSIYGAQGYRNSAYYQSSEDVAASENAAHSTANQLSVHFPSNNDIAKYNLITKALESIPETGAGSRPSSNKSSFANAPEVAVESFPEEAAAKNAPEKSKTNGPETLDGTGRMVDEDERDIT